MTTPVQPDGPYPRTLRRLHLAIAGLVVLLAITGLMIYFRGPLGLQPLKVTLIWTHALIAYAFLCILGVRVFFGLRASDPMHFRHTLPRVGHHLSGRRRMKFAGRSTLSRAIAGVLYAAFAVNAATGIVRAGTDIYLPPLGPSIRAYVAAAGADPGDVRAGRKEHVDEVRFTRVSRAKIPFGVAHIYGAFTIMAVAMTHAIGVALTEWNAPNNRSVRGRARLMLLGPGRR